MKIQFVADAKSLNILSFAVAPGHVHDFRIFKDSNLHISERIRVLADTGYLGIQALHQNSQIPIKSSKYHKLTQEEKVFNRGVAKSRIAIEHINRYLKRFRIFSSRYRNRRNRFALRVALVSAIYNIQH